VSFEARTAAVGGTAIGLRREEAIGGFLLAIRTGDELPAKEFVQEFTSEASAMAGFEKAVAMCGRRLQRSVEDRAVHIYIRFGRRGLMMPREELRDLSRMVDPEVFLSASLGDVPLLLQRAQIEQAAIDAGVHSSMAKGARSEMNLMPVQK
jgi:hypothetical protein